MAIQSEAANRSSIADPEKWLRILQRWRPREPREVLIDFINDLIEAVGPQRIERLDALFVRTDETTRSGREKLDKLRQWRERNTFRSVVLAPTRGARPSCFGIGQEDC